PERWRRLDDLFDAALRLDPAAREAWLRGACGDDDGLRAEVDRLLAQDERADRDGFLTPPEASGRPPHPTVSWPPRGGAAPVDDTGGFTPRAAIAPHTVRPSICEPRSVERARLRELPMIYILILGIAMFWRRAVL